jgi:hypothetical protein
VAFHLVVVDNCPCPERLARKIKVLKRDVPGAVLQSCYRGEDAAHLLHQHGKHTQGELYDGWIHHRPGFNPANPPGFSSHEARSDGNPFYGKPRGAALPWWMVGMDWDDAHIDALIHAARHHGWDLERPYPSGSEHHHLNFRKEPK